MSKPYNKHDAVLDRDLTNVERLEQQRIALRTAQKRLEQFDLVLRKASDKLTEAQLQTICAAVDNALAAAENACYLGTSGYHGQPVRMVRWEEASV